MSTISLDQARAARPLALKRFGKIGTVTGVGVTRVRGHYAVKVNLAEPIKAGIAVPTEVDGVPVKVEITGAIKAR
jgi:hypothetical protein